MNARPITVGSLFSGIGGIDLGLERAGMKIAWHSEIDPYACRILAKHWPDVPNIGDITTTDWNTIPHVDVIAGGYPCPAFSQAARGRNNAPNLWPHMRAAVEALRPRYVIGENVAAHLHDGFADTLADLAALGFDAQWEVLRACHVGAPHPRRRLFFVAYPNGDSEPVRPFDGETSVVRPLSRSRRDWEQTAADTVGTDDGIPYRLDRLRALGNAVVPQLAERIGRQLLAHIATETSAA